MSRVKSHTRDYCFVSNCEINSGRSKFLRLSCDSSRMKKKREKDETSGDRENQKITGFNGVKTTSLLAPPAHSRCVLIILSAPEDVRDTRAEEEARTSRVRHLTPLIRQRSSGTRKSRTGSVTSLGRHVVASCGSEDDDKREDRATASSRRKVETHSRGHARPTRVRRSRLHAAEVQSLRD